jgi:hypothetical protein
MQIEESEQITIARIVPYLFVAIYAILIARVLLSFFAESSSLWLVVFFKRISDFVCAPFWAVLYTTSWDRESGFMSGVISASVCYGLIHYALANAVPVDSTSSIMNKVLNLFRLVFYIGAILLILMIVIRMAVMTYQDVIDPFPRGIIYSVPAKK